MKNGKCENINSKIHEGPPWHSTANKGQRMHEDNIATCMKSDCFFMLVGEITLGFWRRRFKKKMGLGIKWENKKGNHLGNFIRRPPRHWDPSGGYWRGALALVQLCVARRARLPPLAHIPPPRGSGPRAPDMSPRLCGPRVSLSVRC